MSSSSATTSAAAATTLSSSGGGNAGVAAGAQTIENFIPVLAAFIANSVVQFALVFSSEVGLLTALSFMAYALSFAPVLLIEWLATLGDGFIDGYERLFVTTSKIVQWLLFFVSMGFAFAWVSAFLADYPLMAWYEAVALAVVLIVTMLAYLPSTISAVTASAAVVVGGGAAAG